MTVVSVRELSFARKAALVAVVLFAVRFGFFLVPRDATVQVGDGTLQGALLTVAEHAVLFPIIAALSAPGWARAAGFSWLAIDMCTDILALNGADPTIYLGLRLGGHLSAAIWITAASHGRRVSMRWTGYVLAMVLAAASFVSPLLPQPHAFLPLTPTALLLPIWLLMVAADLKPDHHDSA